MKKVIHVKSEATKVCEFRAKISAFYRRLHLAASAASQTFSSKSFSCKKVKTTSEIEVCSEVCFTVDKENRTEPAKQ